MREKNARFSLDVAKRFRTLVNLDRFIDILGRIILIRCKENIPPKQRNNNKLYSRAAQQQSSRVS